MTNFQWKACAKTWRNVWEKADAFEQKVFDGTPAKIIDENTVEINDFRLQIKKKSIEKINPSIQNFYVHLFYAPERIDIFVRKAITEGNPGTPSRAETVQSLEPVWKTIK